jgi:ATP-dependent RNA helicase RhlE
MTFNNSRRRGMDRNSFRHSSSRSSRGRGRAVSKKLDEALYTQPIQDAKSEITDNNSFDSYGLDTSITSIIKKRGYTSATHIQDQVIPHIMEKKDVIGLAQTGSGKTGSYLIPLLHNAVTKEAKNPNAVTLIIVPTRELAFQVENELFEFGIKDLRLFSAICVGGMPIYDQIRKLKKPTQFIIGTPGRLMDLAERGVLKLDKVTSVVVDEVDRMLDMGFIDDINWIMDRIPETRQGLFFSATFNKSIAPILEKLSPNAHLVKVEGQKPSPFVEQSMIHVRDRKKKLETLFDLIKDAGEMKALVFINTKSETERVAQYFSEEGLHAVYLHGGKPQKSRLRTIKDFKSMKTGFLVATDVAARGLDIDDITHVFNYDEPDSVETYIHRIGRTGRAGRYGKAVTLVVK